MNTAQKTPMKFVLVRWLSDETVGVMPLSATKTLRIFGSVVMMKRNRTLYKAVVRRVQE